MKHQTNQQFDLAFWGMNDSMVTIKCKSDSTALLITTVFKSWKDGDLDVRPIVRITVDGMFAQITECHPTDATQFKGRLLTEQPALTNINLN